MIPPVAVFCGICGICGISPEALHARKMSFGEKLYFLTVLGLKETPQIPQTPQPAGRLPGSNVQAAVVFSLSPHPHR